MSIAALDVAEPQLDELRVAPIPVREPRPASRITLTDEPVLGPEHLTLDLAPAAARAPRQARTPARTYASTHPDAPTRTQARLRPRRDPAGRSEPVGQSEADGSAVYPEPSAWATRFLLAALEVTHGVRPAAQLVRWTTPDVHDALARRAALSGRLRAGRQGGAVVGTLGIGTVLTCRPTPHACEVSAVVHDRDRVRAVALRLEGLGSRWRVAALQIG